MSTASSPAAARPPLVSRLVGSKLFLALAVGSAAAALLVLCVRRELPAELPVLGVVPELELRDETGERITKRAFLGRVTVVAFFFTSCTTVCPMLSVRLGIVQQRLRGMADVAQILSISVDPERDTPARLRAYSRGHHARPGFWRFATGDRAEVERVVVGGFRQALQRPDDGQGRLEAFDIVHGGHFVLVDPRARIRGYYDSSEASRIEELVRDVALVAPRAPR